MSSSQPLLTLISHTLCPYVQRAVIALEELGVEFKRIDIDLSNKPDWFTELSPLGKVPVLVVDDDTVLFESAVIAEYINEFSGANLLSTDLVQKAKERAWIEFSSAMLNNIGQLYNAKDETQFLAIQQQLNTKWSSLEANLSNDNFFTSNTFTLVDAAFAPVFRYIDVFENFVTFPGLSRLSKVSRWRKALAQKNSVKSAVGNNYPDALIEFVAQRDSYLGAIAKRHQQDQSAA